MLNRSALTYALLCTVGFVALSGCDLAGEVPSLILPEKRVTFRFEFSSDGRPAGQPFDVTSTVSANLGPALLEEGFTKGEVLSATVLAVELSRVQPIGVNLSTLSSVSLELNAPGVSGVMIAQSASLPDDDDAQLSVVNARVTSYVTAPSFSAILTVDPTALRPDSDYVLTATVRLRIEVEGV